MTSASSERIVCGTDFSPNATAALRWAGALARRTGASIDLVTAISSTVSTYPELVMDWAAVDDELYKQAADRVAAAAAKAAADLNVPVEGHAIHAYGAAPIAQHAKTRGAGLIVLGAHGRSPLPRWLLGSVADRTVRLAECPVVVVPPAIGTEEERTSWGRDPARPVRILVGLDGGPGGDRACAFARDLAARFACDITFLHLYWPIGEYQRLGLQGAHDLFEADPAVVQNLEPGLRQRIGRVPGAGSVSLSIRPAWGDPAANLLAAAEEAESDLLVVGSEQRHGFARLWHPSTSRRLTTRAPSVPVACVPAPAAPAEAPAAPVDIPRLSTILAPTDLSEAGNAAVPYAYALLDGHGGVVELCHVLQRPLPNPPFAYERPRDGAERRRVAALEAELRALIPAQAAARGITTHVSVIDGAHAGEAIVQAAERLRVDAISLAARGHFGLARAVLGSVADHVVRHSRTPVLMAH
jgi:nucleotide-binding universal stress UspA family protein